MFFLVLWGLGIVTAVIDLYMKGFPSDPQLICSVILLHQFVVTFGLLGITGLLSNMIFAKQNAKMVGWYQVVVPDKIRVFTIGSRCYGRYVYLV